MKYLQNENLTPKTDEEWDILRKKTKKETEERYLKKREEALKLLEPRLELLQAFKEGKIIQAFFENAWQDLYMGTVPSSWLFPIDTYRIKEISKFGKPPLNATPSKKETITIPQPKFKVGDVVSIPSGYSNGFTVYSRVYSPDKNMWFYSPNYEDNNSSMFLRLPELPAPKECFDEDELELVERKEK